MRYPFVSLRAAAALSNRARCFLSLLAGLAVSALFAQGPGDAPLPEPTALVHARGVFSVAFTPDSKSIATGCVDGGVRLWDAATGKELRAMTGHTGQVLGVAISPDGKLVASASDDGTVRLWDAASGKELHKLEGHGRNAVGVAFSPDGKALASCGYDQTVRVWDPATGKELQCLRGQPQQILGVAFSPDGKTVASGGVDTTARFWSAADGKETRRLEAHSGYVRGVAFSPDGRTFATAAYDGTTRLWEVATGKVVRVFRLPANGPTGMFAPAFSPDGRMLAVACEDNCVRVWELATGQLVRALTGPRSRVYSVAFSPDGKYLAAGSDDQRALVWDLDKVGAAVGAQAKAGGADVAAKWKALAGDDAGAADEAAWALATAPEEAVAYIRDHLQAIKPVDPKQVDKWVADLDSEQFSAREAASEALAAQGNEVLDRLRAALAARPSLEAQRRLEDLLSREVGASAQQLQVIRSLTVLERVGTPAARELLQKVADGQAGEFVKGDARAALDRLGRRSRQGSVSPR